MGLAAFVAVTVLLPAVAAFVSGRVGPVVLGAVAAWTVVGWISLQVTDADLHMDGFGVLIVWAEIAALAAIGAYAGLLLRRRLRPGPEGSPRPLADDR
jgi:hypothetical protein